MIVYLDTSALVKLLAEESESVALAAHLDALAADSSTAAAAALAETELRRFASRAGIAQTAVSTALARLTIIDMDRGLYREAGLLPGENLRSLDALHIAVALHVAADQFITYDLQQRVVAESMGLLVSSPGASE